MLDPQLKNKQWPEPKAREEKIQQDFLWARGPKATHQITPSENRTERDSIKRDKLVKSCNRYYLPKKNKHNSRGDFLEQNKHTETTEDHWEKLFEGEKECDFPKFSTELFISKFITSTTDKNLREKLLKKIRMYRK